MKNKAIKLSAFLPATLAVLVITAQVIFTHAASYSRTTLRDMTQRASAVAEVTVLKRTYPAIKANEFPRTNIEVTVNKTFKGSLPETITLDLPGGVHGNTVYAVPDSANFEINERAMVFIKEPTPGVYMVQDLGLGKFNLVNRNNQTFVESPLCPRAMQLKNDDMEASLLTKSIPYNDFCKLVSAYATNDEPAVNPMKLAMLMNADHIHNSTCIHNALNADALKNAAAANQSSQWLNFAFSAMFLCCCAAAAVALRRRNAKLTPARASIKSVALILGSALLAGAALGGSFSLAYVASGSIWNLDDTANPGKVSGGQVVWSQSTQISKTNASCFASVQASFDKWASVTGSRLSFKNAGNTNLTQHSSSDGVNFIVWEPNPSSDFSSATLAITYTVYSVGGTSNFIDADMVFNDRDFSWAPGAAGNINSVSLHEIGHFVGLNHTTNAVAVMYPYDGGLTNLSADEIQAAVTLYPVKAGTPPPPPPVTPPSSVGAPIAALSGSPLTGPAPLNSFFDASTSTAGTNPIASYTWDFGDASTGSGKNTAHLFSTAGNFTVTLTVTDTKGLVSTASVTVNVNAAGNGGPGSNGTDTGSLLRGVFKLAFASTGRDSFAAIFYSDKAATFAVKNSKSATGPTSGVLTIGNATFNFSLDTTSRKGYGDSGMKVQLNSKNGTITVILKSADLQNTLAAYGAVNQSTTASVNVPMSIVFGNGADLSVSTTGNFQYFGFQRSEERRVGKEC